MDKLLNRFLKYISFDTHSDDTVLKTPSTEKQKDLGRFLVDELHSLGVDNAYIDEYSYVYGYIKGTVNTKTVGLIAHLDTATEMPGKVTNPNIIDYYHGETIHLSNNVSLNPNVFQNLNNVLGHKIVTTDGTTLLGGDDKAGIAIIMSTVEKLLQGNYNYPNIFICFTPDEEIGGGTAKFNYDYFKVDFAYTLDGGAIDIINYETFNAASAIVTLHGENIHPGDAKDKMLNSALVAMEFQNMLPNIRPENTEGYEGFNHLCEINGNVNTTTLKYIIRNHDKILFEKQINDFLSIEKNLNQKYNKEVCNVEIIRSYKNMKEKIEEVPYVLEYPVQALKSFGYNTSFIPIRGGTDGANLSYNGIPCLNLGTGTFNMHGPYEYSSITDMNPMVSVLIKMFEFIK